MPPFTPRFASVLCWLSLLLTLVLAGCSTIIQQRVVLHPSLKPTGPRHVALFLDGTANDPASRTNVIRLFEIVSNQNRPDIASFYNEGVGTGARIVGAITGAGIGTDIEQSYAYLLREFAQEADPQRVRLHMFGFSRGAFTARALAGLVWTAGIPVLNDSKSDYWLNQLVYEVYAAYHELPNSEAERRARVQAVYDSDKWRGRIRTVIRGVMIDNLGVWDTVESLGARGLGAALRGDNLRYVDQLCNVKRAMHALSLEDNRSTSFAPMLMDVPKRWAECPQRRTETEVQEVWFAGAHADVGGGYDDDGGLSGVSLNWMLEQLSRESNGAGALVAPHTRVWEDPLAIGHDAQGNNAIYRAFLDRGQRPLLAYLCGMNGGQILISPEVSGPCTVPLEKPLRLHESVLKRRQLCVNGIPGNKAGGQATVQLPEQNSLLPDLFRPDRWNQQTRQERLRDCSANYQWDWFNTYPFAGCVPGSGEAAKPECRDVISWVQSQN